MGKDIEWLVQTTNTERDSLRQRLESGRGTDNETTFNEGMDWALKHVLKMIGHLDKHEALSQELPVIPRYVADWIEAEQGTMSNWKLPSRFISDSKYKKDQRRYKWSQVEGNMDKFMGALINGYEIEKEPLFYAKIKGHELIVGEDACKYWKCDMRNGSMFLSNRYSHHGRYLAEMSKNDWGKFGINDSNANFVRVDE